MRRHHWSAPVLAMLVALASSRDVIAQSAPFDDEPASRVRLAAEAQPTEPYPNAGLIDDDPGPATYNPYDFYPPGGYNPAYPPPMMNAPIGPSSIPPGGSLPWPTISPFDNQFDQHKNVGGLWKNDFNNRGIQYNFSASYLYAKFRRPNDRLVGSPNPNIPDYNIDAPELFSPVTMNETFRFPAKTSGMDLRWGYTNPDDSGLELRGLWLTNVTSNYKQGSGHGDINNSSVIGDTNGIPWFDGSATFGAVAAYDILFKLQYDQQAAGVSLNFIETPWLKGKYYKVQPMLGVRYLFVGEKFTFHGTDSNLVYVVQDGGTAEPGTVGPNPNGIGPYSAYFRSEVQSHLIGPEVGLQYDLGGKKFKLWGQTRVGLMGNIELASLQGRNLGDGFTIDFSQINTFFQQNQNTGHVSPLFEQSFFAETPIFQLIPYVNRWDFMKGATLRLGYSFLAAGDISRPESNIIYRGWPLVSELKVERSVWYTSNFSFGVNWAY